MTCSAIEILHVARKIANYAKDAGVLSGQIKSRLICEHVGAVLADSVLQAGLSYMSVVRPRVLGILKTHPSHSTVSSLVLLIEKGGTSTFLNWRHREKINRFEALVLFLQSQGVESIEDLREALRSVEFCEKIQTVNGIGPKTVDYMACLVGIDSIAIDRHVRSFAKAVGVENNDYQFLRAVFCCAADLLSLPRRDFDAWLWMRASAPISEQMVIKF